MGEGLFPVAAPTLRNSLPWEIKASKTQSYRKRINKYFDKAFAGMLTQLTTWNGIRQRYY